MAISEIILWTTSLTLAVGGITFGIKASVNATKANKQIQEIVADQMVSEEASKYFFTQTQYLNSSNKKVIKILMKEEEITYSDYSALASRTRMAPLPSRIEKHLEKTEFKDVTIHYLEAKERLENSFKDIFGDLSILVENKAITKTKLAKLIKYHEHVSTEQTAILKEYTHLTKV